MKHPYKPDAWVAKWCEEKGLTWPPGKCLVCDRVLVRKPGARGRPAFICPQRRRPKCRKQYLQRYHLAHTNTRMQPVQKVEEMEKAGWFLAHLACGCRKEYYLRPSKGMPEALRCARHIFKRKVA